MHGRREGSKAGRNETRKQANKEGRKEGMLFIKISNNYNNRRWKYWKSSWPQFVPCVAGVVAGQARIRRGGHVSQIRAAVMRNTQLQLPSRSSRDKFLSEVQRVAGVMVCLFGSSTGGGL